MTLTDKHHLTAAQGWLELGLLTESFEELEQVAPENRLHPDVLKLRWQIYAKAERWGTPSPFEIAQRNGTEHHWKTKALEESDLAALRKESKRC